MKKIGMIGGFGPEATLDYYRLLIKTYRKEIKDGSNPEIIICSMDVNILLNMVANKQLVSLVYPFLILRRFMLKVLLAIT